MSSRTDQHRKWRPIMIKNLAHITWCEACGDPNCKPVHHAHRKKMRFIGYQTHEDFLEYTHWVAKLGDPCHAELDENWNKDGIEDFDAHQIMFDFITSIVTNRVDDIHIA